MDESLKLPTGVPMAHPPVGPRTSLPARMPAAMAALLLAFLVHHPVAQAAEPAAAIRNGDGMGAITSSIKPPTHAKTSNGK